MTTGIANRAEINVTPLIDVLLVLLLIFMIIAPITSHGLDAQIPVPGQAGGARDEREIVVRIGEDRAVTINAEPVSWQELSDRFTKIFARRADKVVFVAAAPRVDFDDVARVIDTARGAGVERVALMPRQSGAAFQTK